MDERKKIITQKIKAIMLADYCKNLNTLLFKEELCTQERILRFSSPLLMQIFQGDIPVPEQTILYEIYNGIEDLKIKLTMQKRLLPHVYMKTADSLIRACPKSVSEKGVVTLKTWYYETGVFDRQEKFLEVLQDFFEVEFPFFEKELQQWFFKHSYRIKDFPEQSLTPLYREELPENLLMEGALKQILLDKYERNITARRRCIAHYGTSCQICGYNFGDTFGTEFDNKIEVHHIVPISQIGEQYVVDPVRDMLPVCPNCHMILHSKKDGVYLPDEVKKMLH